MKDIFEIEVKDDVTRVSAFICRHGDEHIAEAEALKKEVYEWLGEKYTVGDGNFLTIVVLELNWEHSAHISSIYCDQWSMVCADSLDEKFKVTVQCDIVEDGIAAVYKAFREHHGTPVPDE
ncbi:MAG TPA: hypothetical protein VGR71_01260 [Nitrospira sp.]|nr:hypothetical protein [Nitrospira sp.]